MSQAIGSLRSEQKEPVTLRGWVHKVQAFKKHTFVILRDGAGDTSKVQIFIPKTVYAEEITQESYLEVYGSIKHLPDGAYSYHPFEVHATDVKVLSLSRQDFASKCPVGARMEVRLDQRIHYLRSDEAAAKLKLRSMYLQSLRKHFEDAGCTEVVPPCFVGNQCEGGATLFKIDHVGQAAYLTQSSQFYLEFCCPSVGDTYCIYPSFRAEKSLTRRHLTEFLHAEAEWVDVQTMDQHIGHLKALLKDSITYFLKLDQESGFLQKLGRKETVTSYLKMIDEAATMTHRQAIDYCRSHEIYKDEETKEHFGDRDDIPEAQERKMIDQIGKIVFLTHFPIEHKSPYMAKDIVDSSYVLGCDVEVPGVGEVIGSGIRVTDPQELTARFFEAGLPLKDYKDYIELREYGHGHTSGMGLGVDRMLTWLLGEHSIREVVTFPRYPGRLFP